MLLACSLYCLRVATSEAFPNVFIQGGLSSSHAAIWMLGRVSQLGEVST